VARVVRPTRPTTATVSAPSARSRWSSASPARPLRSGPAPPGQGLTLVTPTRRRGWTIIGGVIQSIDKESSVAINVTPVPGLSPEINDLRRRTAELINTEVLPIEDELCSRAAARR